MAAVVLGMSSCSETWDDNPVVKTHEGIQEAAFLNTPVMQNIRKSASSSSTVRRLTPSTKTWPRYSKSWPVSSRKKTCPCLIPRSICA